MDKITQIESIILTERSDVSICKKSSDYIQIDINGTEIRIEVDSLDTTEYLIYIEDSWIFLSDDYTELVKRMKQIQTILCKGQVIEISNNHIKGIVSNKVYYFSLTDSYIKPLTECSVAFLLNTTSAHKYGSITAIIKDDSYLNILCEKGGILFENDSYVYHDTPDIEYSGETIENIFTEEIDTTYNIPHQDLIIGQLQFADKNHKEILYVADELKPVATSYIL